MCTYCSGIFVCFKIFCFDFFLEIHWDWRTAAATQNKQQNNLKRKPHQFIFWRFKVSEYYEYESLMLFTKKKNWNLLPFVNLIRRRFLISLRLNRLVVEFVNCMLWSWYLYVLLWSDFKNSSASIWNWCVCLFVCLFVYLLRVLMLYKYRLLFSLKVS